MGRPASEAAVIDLTVYPDRIYHHEPKEPTMTNTNLPDWEREAITEQIVKLLTGWALNSSYTVTRTNAETMASALAHLIPVRPEPTAPELPDLSRWHPVPVGAVIPEGTEYIVAPSADMGAWQRSSFPFANEDDGYLRWTEHPLPAHDPDRAMVDAIRAVSDPDVARSLLAAIRAEALGADHDKEEE